MGKKSKRAARKDFDDAYFDLFKPTKANTGPVTCNGKVLTLVHEDGKPVMVGDLLPGEEYEFNVDTGVVRRLEKI